MTYDADLNLLVCEHVTSSLVRESPDGARETIAPHFEGKELNCPNDVSSTPTARSTSATRGTAACPASASARARARLPGRLPDPARGGDLELSSTGRLRHAERPLLLARRVAAVHQRHAAGAHQASSTSKPTGRSSNGRMFFEGIGSGDIEEGIPDGMKCDEHGNIWVTGPGGIWVISPAGEHSARSRSRRSSATSLGRRRTGTRSSFRPRPRSTRSDEGRAATRALHALRRRTMANEASEPGSGALRADRPGPAERRDHRRRRLRRVRLARAREGAERRRERQGLADGVPREGHPRDPRPLHRRGGRAGAEAERAALPGRQGHGRARPRHVGRRARRRAWSRRTATTSSRRCG